MSFLFIALPSLLFVMLAKFLWNKDICGKEMAVHFGAAIIISLVCLGLSYTGGMFKVMDTEILNGYVTSKYSQKVSCGHQYQCGQTCTSDSKGNQTCVPIYCDEHNYDVDWNVETTVGNLEIDRVDRQGVDEPPRFSKVSLGEPASVTHSTKNYLLAQEDSLFYVDPKVSEKYKDKLPKYPEVYDYYRFNHVINLTKQNTDSYSVLIQDKLKKMGAEKQVNLIVVVTNESQDFYKALMASWSGGKKNDVILVYGLKDDKIVWFNSTSFADGMNNKELHAKLRQEALGEVLSMSVVNTQLNEINKSFNRLPNEEFQYIVDSLEPSTGTLVFFSLLSLIASVLVGLYFKRNQVF